MNDASPTIKRILTPVGIGLLVPLLATWSPGCKKDQPPPPLPSATAQQTASAPLELEPEDAGKDADADAGKKKKVYRGVRKKGGLAACCAALAQNSKNAPPPTNLYMAQAAAMCSALNAQGKDKASAGGAIAGALKGAGMPGACR